MNELERLKRAEEAEPMAVWIMEMPKYCGKCPAIERSCLSGFDGFSDYVCRCSGKVISDLAQLRPDDCKLRQTIGIIEPSGHVVYLREMEE